MPQTTDKPLVSRACELLSERGRMRLAALISARHLRKYDHIRLPLEASRLRHIVIFAPETPLEALYQLPTVASVVSLYKGVRIVLICELRVANFFEHIEGIDDIVTYDSEYRYLFSRELATLGQMLGDEEFDVCLFLQQSPDASLLHLMAQLSPQVRIGYDGAAEYPFFNVRVRLSDRQQHVSDQNFCIARILGAQPPRAGRWTVSKQTVEEIRHMFKEWGIEEQAHAGGLDAGLFFEAFGEKWCDELLGSLTSLSGISWYLYADGVAEGAFLEWLKRTHLPVFSALSPSRSAALASQSTVVVSGRAVLFELASLLTKPVVGVFHRHDLSRSCGKIPNCLPVTFTGRPDQETIRSIVSAIKTLTA